MLLYGCPRSVEVNGKRVYIRTDARYYINLGYELEMAEDDYERSVCFLSCIKYKKTLRKGVDVSTFSHIEKSNLVKYIQEFYYCVYEKINDYIPEDNKTYNKAFDYEIDGGRIYSAFFQTYGIDIESQLDTMHWWKFKALFNNLSGETKLVSYYMKYRNYDTNSYEYKSDKKGEFRKSIDEIIKGVSFEVEASKEELRGYDPFADARQDYLDSIANNTE